MLRTAHAHGWVAELPGEGMRFLEALPAVGATCDVMIEGPPREAMEPVEVG